MRSLAIALTVLVLCLLLANGCGDKCELCTQTYEDIALDQERAVCKAAGFEWPVWIKTGSSPGGTAVRIFRCGDEARRLHEVYQPPCNTENWYRNDHCVDIARAAHAAHVGLPKENTP